MPVTGDFKKLSQIVRKVESLATAGFRGRLFKNLAQEAKTQVAFGFEKGTAPDGTPWKPLSLRSGQPLRDTGRLLNSLLAEPVYTSTGFTIGTRLIYAATQQYGDPNRVPKNAKMLAWRSGGRSFFARKVSIPARPFLPQGTLPAGWVRAFKKAAIVQIRKELAL